MKIAIVGCSHGELDKIYDQTRRIENERHIKIDLLICCGDFQATRNEADLRCMSVPPKFYNIGSFYKYYSGEKIAPCLTIFIGGNHEASNYLQELPYGGWVAPKIYYVGYAGVVNYGGLRIGGISGIFKGFDYMKGHHEKAPYNEGSKKSVYHLRNVEVFKLKQLSNSMDIMMSHDWPRGVYNYGCVDTLIRKKPFFKKEIYENKLGSNPTEELLFHIKPKYWFSAHLHTMFSATVPHNSVDGVNKSETNFLALDKCLNGRKWIEVIDIPSEEDSAELCYDLEWLTILHLTDHLMSYKNTYQYMPGPSSDERWCFVPTEEEKEFIKKKMNDDLRIPENFVRTAVSYEPHRRNKIYHPPHAVVNPQTVLLCEKLGITDPLSHLMDYSILDDSCASPLVQGASPPAHSTPEICHNDSTYMSFNSSNFSDENTSICSGRSSLSNSTFASPSFVFGNAAKKQKLSFPSIREDKSNNSSSLDLLEFNIDRTGTNVETPPTIKREFKRRNASLYTDDS